MDSDWIEGIRKIVLQAVEAGKPCDLVLGEVVGTAPLSVRIDQKTTLAGPQLLIPRQLTDYDVLMSIPGVGSVTVLVKNGLMVGDPVLLLQKRGAQQYLVIDRY